MINIKKSLKIITIITALLLSNVSAYASDEHERTELARLVIELKTLENIIQAAKRSAELDSRIQFNYDTLENDIALIQQGIKDYINTIKRDPRNLPEINGEYRR